MWQPSLGTILTIAGSSTRESPRPQASKMTPRQVDDLIARLNATADDEEDTETVKAPKIGISLPHRTAPGTPWLRQNAPMWKMSMQTTP